MLRQIILILPLALILGCSNNTVATDSKIAVTPVIPQLEPCQRRYVSVKKDTFLECLLDGMSHAQVAQIIGWEGNLGSQSGDKQIWQWGNGSGGYITVGFVGDRLVSKSQVNLE